MRAPPSVTVRGMLAALASLVAPPLCALCGEPCGYDAAICRRCDSALGRLPPVRRKLPGGLEVLSAAPYDGIAGELVRKLKFGARLALAAVAAERMARAWGLARAGCLVEVPPAPARERARGFDLAYVLARSVAAHAPGATTQMLLRRDDGPRQAERSRAERRADPPRIRPIDAGRTPPPELWLVDDVVTTGATLQACAAVLRELGAPRVRALTFAAA